MHSVNFLKATMASAVSAAILLCGTAPATARDNDRAKVTAAPRAAERTYSAPREVERTYTPPRAIERTYAAPRAIEPKYSAPRAVERTYTPPREVERTYTAPREVERTYTPPREVERAPMPYVREVAPVRKQELRVQTTPRAVERTYAPVRTIERRAPILQIAPRERFARTAPRTHFVQQVAPRERFGRTTPRMRSVQAIAPRERFVRAAPRAHILRTAPFVQRVEPSRIEARENRAPFREVIRIAPRTITRFTTTRQVVMSPLMRAVFVPRRRARVVYHPAYIVGRVVEIRRQVVVLQPPFGQRIFVNASALPRPAAYLPMNAYVTVPVIYANGMYSIYEPPGYIYNNYGYNGYPYNSYPYNGYAYDGYPYNGYPYGAAAYCNNGSSAIYAALLPTILGAVSGGGSLNANDLAALALSAVASGYNSCSPGFGGYPGTYNGYPGTYNVYPGTYNAYPGSYNAYPPAYNTYPTYGSYATPYDNCAWGDNDGDDSYCAAQYNGYNPYGYNQFGYSSSLGYPGFGGYGMQQVQGLVVARTGSMLMVLAGNGMNPIFVDAAPAFQNGYSVNGPVAVGQVIDAYGFYNGDTFVATALV